MNLNKNVRFSCLNGTSFSEQTLALLALNAPIVFHIFLFLLNGEATPTDHTNKLIELILFPFIFGGIFCTVCKKGTLLPHSLRNARGCLR